MKRIYLLLHIAAIPIYLIVTYLAFIVFLPSYLLVVFIGFDFLKKNIENSTKQNNYIMALAIGVLQAFSLMCLVLIQFKIFGLPLEISQLELALGFAAYFTIGFIFITIITTFFQRRSNVNSMAS